MAFYVPTPNWQRVGTGVGAVTFRCIGAVRVAVSASEPAAAAGRNYGWSFHGPNAHILDAGGESVWVKAANPALSPNGFFSAIWIDGAGTFQPSTVLPPRKYRVKPSQIFPELLGKVAGIAVPRPELVSGGNDWLMDIASRGFKFIRFEVYWDQIQAVRGGPLNLASTDAIVNNVRALGLHVVLCPTGKPAWTDGRLDTAQKREDFAAYCGDIAKHYKGRCDNFEVCNEPNLGVCTPENYTLALQLAYPAIKEANPLATVCSAGIANASATSDATRYYKPQDWLSRCYAVAGGMPCDMVGFHPYTWPKLYSDGDVADGLHRMSSHVRRLMVANGDGNKKIFVSEVGSPSGGDNAWGAHAPLTEAFQNQFFEEAFPLFEDADYVGGVAIYSYRDNSAYTSMEAYFGLYDVSGGEKLAMATVEAFNGSYGAQ